MNLLGILQESWYDMIHEVASYSNSRNYPVFGLEMSNFADFLESNAIEVLFHPKRDSIRALWLIARTLDCVEYAGGLDERYDPLIDKFCLLYQRIIE